MYPKLKSKPKLKPRYGPPQSGYLANVQLSVNRLEKHKKLCCYFAHKGSTPNVFVEFMNKTWQNKLYIPYYCTFSYRKQMHFKEKFAYLAVAIVFRKLQTPMAHSFHCFEWAQLLATIWVSHQLAFRRASPTPTWWHCSTRVATRCKTWPRSPG